MSGWRRSSFCVRDGCVEVARLDGLVALRSTRQRGDAPIVFSEAQWKTLVALARAGRLEGRLSTPIEVC